MDIVEALASLVRVTEAGSFSAVARERDVSKAAVTRQISYLEQHFSSGEPVWTTANAAEPRVSVRRCLVHWRELRDSLLRAD